MKKVISFIGGDSQVGTTMVAQSVSEYLAKQDKRVLLLLTGWGCGEDYINSAVTTSIDDIRVNLKEKQLSSGELQQMLVHNKKVDILPGVRNPITTEYYDDSSLCVLVDMCREEYDYIVIDGGWNFLNGLTNSAVLCADKIYFVVTQQEKTLRRLDSTLDLVWERLNKPLVYIINKFNHSPAFYSKKQTMELLKSSDLICLDYIPYGWQAEMDRSTLLRYPKFERGIKKIVSDIGENSSKRYPRGKHIRKGAWAR